MLAGVIRQTQPAILFAPFWIDAHPDHLAATELVEAARFWSKLTKSDLPGVPHHPRRIYNYYCVHLKMAAQPAFVLDISDQWEKKRLAIECFQSQFVVGREDVSPGFIDQLEIEAAFWGKTIGVRFGEPFNCREPIGLSDFQSLI
jgi:LmbE family N-acetylglucosaminyl deacetylase